MSRLIAVLALVSMVSSSAPAPAGDNYEVTVSRGLLEYSRGRFSDALALFSLAETLHGDDARPRYYRGVCLLRLGRYGEAGDAFRESRARGARDSDIPFYLGVCALQAGNYAEALEEFRKAGEADPGLAGLCRYYRGVAMAREGRRDSALEEWREALAFAGEDPALARACGEALSRGEEPPPGRLSGRITTRYEYDTNVALAPSNLSLVDLSHSGDWRFMTDTAVDFKPIVRERFELDTEYLFSQSLNQDLSFYNLQSHDLVNTFRLTRGVFRPFFGYDYQYYFLRTAKESFYRTHRLFAGADVVHGPRSFTEFTYAWSTVDFFLPPTLPADNLDVNNNNDVGFTHYLSLGARGDSQFYCGFHYDREDTAGRNFFYDGYRFNGGLAFPVAGGIRGNADMCYYIRDFSRNTDGRTDHRQEYSLSLWRQLTRALSGGVSYDFIDNNSTMTLYEFRRNIFTVFLTAGF